MIKKITFFFFFFLSTVSFAQRISGIIIDSLSLDPLPGAGIADAISNKENGADSKGQFSLVVKDRALITVSFIGYKPFRKAFIITSDTTITIKMQLSNTTLLEVEVVGNSSSNSSLNQPLTTLNQIKILKIPSTLGESDVVKMLATSPGVKQVEGQQGFNVRGSSQDQNLILYDEAIIYNSSHLLGIYSVFNTNAIQNVSFYKSGIPARWGGRLASAMIVEGNAGSYNQWQNHVSLGLLSSNVSFSGPLIKDKCSFSISARRSYIDLLIMPLVNVFTSKKAADYDKNYFFQDLNAKISYKLNPSNKVEATVYGGNDAFLVANSKNELSNDIQWGNKAASIKWRHLFNEKLSTTNSIAWSSNFLQYKVNQILFAMDMRTSINTLKYKSDWLYTTNKTSLRFGLEMLKNNYNPDNINANVKEYSLNFGSNTILRSIENALYLEYPVQIGTRISVVPGVRYSMFSHIGPFTKYISNDINQIKDSVQFLSGQIVKTYSSPEPRILGVYTIDNITFLKSSLSYNIQYNHLIPIVPSALPIEMWLPSMEGIVPQKAVQFSCGYYKTKADYTYSIDTYYKKMMDVSEAVGTMLNFFRSANISNVVAQGKGYAYGIEFSFEKTSGTFTYAISYAFSRSMRVFSMYDNGKPFPAKYDKPHDLTIIGSYPITKRLTISSLFTYTSGVNITLPVSRYFIQNNIINVYGTKNGYRMPAYHRADISLKYVLTDRPKFKSDLILSISNIYNHSNPYFMYYNVTGSIQQYKLKVETQKVYLFPILPSLTYNISF